MPDRPRILVLESHGHSVAKLLESCQADCDIVRVDSITRGLDLLRTESFAGVLMNPCDPAIWEGTGNLFEAKRVLETLVDGVAVVSSDLHILWSNPMFDTWCGGPAQGKGFYEALGSPEILGPEYCPFHSALAGTPVTTRLHCRDNRYVELHITPVHDPGTNVNQLISLGRNVTAEVQQQQKLDALHKAGRELAALSTDELADMSVAERVELLKLNIRRFTHDLLHYDVIEVRLLDRQTGRLEPLLEEGMTPDAAQRGAARRGQGERRDRLRSSHRQELRLCRYRDGPPVHRRGAGRAARLPSRSSSRSR